METRRLLAADWQDPFNRLDVTGDGLVTPKDVLAVINKVNRDGFGALPEPRPEGSLSYDTNGDGLLAPVDVLAVVNGINGDATGPELIALLANDTARGGTTNDDRITADPEISGQLTDITGIVRFQADWNGQMVQVPVARDGNFSFVPPFALDGSDDGPQTVRLVAVDARNNQTAQDFSLTLATVPPLPDRLGLTAATDTGVSDTDNVTNHATPTAEVTIASGNRVELWLNGSRIGEEVSDGSSQFNLPTLAEGQHQLQVVVEDIAGNIGPLSPPANVIVDTTAPTAMLDAPARIQTVTRTLDVLFSELVSDVSLALSSYRLEVTGGSQVPLGDVGDLPGNRVRLQFPAALENGDYRLTITNPPTDLAGNPLSGSTEFLLEVDRLTAVAEISPAAGEELVSVTRETIVRFDSPIDPATVNEDAFYLVANGQRVAGRRVVSSTQRFMTFFYDSPLPAATEVRVVVDGDRIRSVDGRPVDADRDGQPGGLATADFRTLPLTRIPNTNVFGFVRDSFSGEPIVGVTIRVDAFPEANVVTDQEGRFELVDMPAPDFFVHIDGSTATNTPQGFTYPNVGKPFHSVPGQTVQLEMAGQPFDIFLPPMALDDVWDLSMTEESQVGFGAAGKADLALMFPDVDPAMFDRMAVTIAPGAAVDEQGNAATQAAVIPVPPDRIPAPLPPNLDPALVVSIQTPGATNFDVPAAVSFPNLEGLAPGEQTVVMSFDHDAGKWVVNGTATVSDDGLSIVSDGGVIAAPGWHITQQGTTPDIKPNPDAPAPDRDDDGQPDVPDNDDDNDGQTDMEDPDQEYEWEITVGVRGMAGFTPPELEVQAGLNVPNVVMGLPGDDEIIVGYHDEWKPFEERSGDFDFSYSFTLSEFWADFIDPVTVSLPTFEVSAELSAGLGVAGIIDITGGEPELEFDDIEFRPGNVQLEFAFQIKDTFLCHLPFDIGEKICQKHDATFTYGPPNVKKDTISIPLDRIPVLDYNAEFFAGLSLSASMSASVTPTIYVTKERVPAAPSFFRFSAGPSAATSVPSYSSSDGIGSDSEVYLLFETEGGTRIRTTSGAVARGDVVLPSETAFTLYAYAPESNRTAVYSGETGRSGSRLADDLPMTQIGGFDLDGDGVPDLGEQVLGTALDLSDSDDDGIDDLAELQQGLNPLDNRGFPTGIIASLPLQGEAREVVLVGSTLNAGGQLAYLATGSHGLAIVDTTQFDNPIVLGQLDLTGNNVDVAVDAERQVAVLAAGDQGLHLVDVSDPMQPVLIRTVPLAAEHVELLDGVAYATDGNQLQAIDLLTGELMERISVGDAPITGFSREAGGLFVMDEAKRLTSIRLGSFGMEMRDQVTLNHGGGRLFVGGGVAYAPAASYFRGGFATIDVSNPDQLVVISESDVASPFIAPAQHVIANGSGLGLLLGQPGGTSVLDVMNLADLENTNEFVTRFNLPAAPSSMALGSGIAFLADGTAGLQVINFLPFDNFGQPPTVQIDTDALDADPGTDGIQVLEGTTVRIQPEIQDDVQVRNVELLVDGAVAANDVSFPFDFTAVTPSLAGGRNALQLRVRAFDTGGNATLSDPLTLQLVPDTFPPKVVSVTPGEGSRRFAGHRTVRARFSEPMDTDTLTATNVRLVNLAAPDTPLPVEDIRIRRDDHEVQLTYAPLPVGDYRLTLVHSGLTDRSGNAISGEDTAVEFRVLEDRDPGETLPAALDIGRLDAPLTMPERIGEDELGNPDPIDLIRLELAQPRNVAFELTDRADGAYLELIANLDQDAEVDSSEVIRRVWTSSDRDLSIELDLEAGEYFVRIRPYRSEDVTAYTLNITPGTVIVSTTPSDPGSNYANALDMGTLTSAAVTFEDIVGVWDRSDFHKFTIDAPRQVTMTASDRTDGAELRLYVDLDGDGEVDAGERIRHLQTSGANDLELALDLEAGEYFVEVENYWDDDITAYALTVTPGTVIVPTTPSDPGGDYANALDLGALVSAAVAFEDMVGVWDRSDFYKFTIDAPRQVTTTVSNRTDGAELRLYADLDGDGEVHSGERIRHVQTSGVGELTLDLDLEAGEYFVEVENYWDDDITAYALTVTPGTVIVPTTPSDPGSDYANALDLGTLAGAAVRFEDMVGVWDRSDFYKFTVDAPRQVTMTASDRKDGAELRLYADLDGDGEVDSGERIRNTQTSNVGDLTLELDLEAGEYFVEVENYWDDDITSYALTVTPGTVIVPTTPADPGSDYANALAMGTLAGAAVRFEDMVGVWDRSDFYSFTIDAPRQVTMTASDRKDGAELRLYADLDGNGEIAFGERIRQTSTSGAGDLTLELDLEAGEYFVEVENYWDDDITSYGITVTPGTVIVPTTPADPGSDYANALDMGTLASAAVTFEDIVGVWDRSDFYQFAINAPRQVTMTASDRKDGAELRLYADLDGNGEIAFGERIRQTSTSGVGDLTLDLDLEAGEYFVEVENYWDDDITSYAITVTPGTVIVPTPPADPGESFGTALFVGALDSTAVTFDDMYGVRDPEDFYRFTLADSRNVQIAVTNRRDGVQLALYQDVNDNGQIDSGERIGYDANSSDRDVSVSEALDAGEYFIRVWYYHNLDISAYTITVTPS